MPDMQDNNIDEELGVNEEFAEELRERMKETDQGAPSLLDGVLESIQENLHQTLSGEAESRRWVAILVGAMMEGVRETERLAQKTASPDEEFAVRKAAVSLYQERMVERAIDGTLFNPLNEDHPDTFKEILTERFPEWAVNKAQSQVSKLKNAGG